MSGLKILTQYFSFACVLLLGVTVHADLLDQSMNIEIKTGKIGAQSQATINTISEKTKAMLLEYQAVLRELDQLKNDNKALSSFIDTQESKKASLSLALAQSVELKRDIVPLMQAMLNTLQQFVHLDAPFERDERLARIHLVGEALKDAEVTFAEQFELLLNVYKQEWAYGQNTSVYQGVREIKTQSTRVNYLRVGRVSFLYQTIDGGSAAIWDHENHQWLEIPNQYSGQIKAAMEQVKGSNMTEFTVIPVVNHQ
jgi:hypothetical protein